MTHLFAFSREAAWIAFSSMIQASLNQFRENHNAHNIRKQKNVDLPSGYSPAVMWENPAMFTTGK
jgi:hypothetical protein